MSVERDIVEELDTVLAEEEICQGQKKTESF